MYTLDEAYEQCLTIPFSGSLSGLTETTTAFSFLQHWSSYKKKKDIIAFAKVLESCEPASFPKIFSSSLDACITLR